MIPPKPEVLVVGAGPVGLMTALELRLNGTDVTVIEERPDRGTRSKATTIWARQLELLDRHGLSAPVIAAGTRIGRITVSSPLQRLATFQLSDLHTTTFPFGISLPQPAFEGILRDRLDELEVEIREGTTLVGLKNEASRVQVELRTDAGAVEHHDFAFVVGADGATSTVREALAISFVQYGPPLTFAITDVAIDGPVPSHDVGYYYSDRGAVGLVPLGGTVFRIATGVAPGSPLLGRDGFRDVLTERAGIDGELGDLPWESHFHVKFCHAERYSRGRVALVGDAAHTMSPAGGQGMNTGLQDAANLAWRITEIVDHGALVDPILDGYTRERRSDVHRVMNTSRLLTRFGSHGTTRGNLERRALSAATQFIPAVRRNLTRRMVQLDTTYAPSPRWLRLRGLRVGDRFPQLIPTTHGTRQTYHWSGHRPDLRTPDAAQVLQLNSSEVLPAAAHALGRRARALTVRPDGHIDSITPLPRTRDEFVNLFGDKQ